MSGRGENRAEKRTVGDKDASGDRGQWSEKRDKVRSRKVCVVNAMNYTIEKPVGDV